MSERSSLCEDGILTRASGLAGGAARGLRAGGWRSRPGAARLHVLSQLVASKIAHNQSVGKSYQRLFAVTSGRTRAESNPDLPRAVVIWRISVGLSRKILPTRPPYLFWNEVEKVCGTPHDAGGSLDLRSESVSRLRLGNTLVSLFVLVPFAFRQMLALARLALLHKPPESVVRSPLTLVPLWGGNAVTHLRA